MLEFDCRFFLRAGIELEDISFPVNRADTVFIRTHFLPKMANMCIYSTSFNIEAVVVPNFPNKLSSRKRMSFHFCEH